MKLIRDRKLVIILCFSLIINIVPVQGLEGRIDKTISESDIISPVQEEILYQSTSSFTINNGQWCPEILFKGSVSFGDIALIENGVLFHIPYKKSYSQIDDELLMGKIDDDVSSQKGIVIKYEFLGSNNVIPEGRKECYHKSNFFKGNNPCEWYTNVSNFREVWFYDLWEGIDLSYKMTVRGPKYDFNLHPGSDPDDIKVRVIGQDSLSIFNRNLLINKENSIVLEEGGLSCYYPEKADINIPSEFRMIGEDVFGFKLNDYDKDKDIVIDPLVYSTFINGIYDDLPFAIYTDEDGSSYLTGDTDSTDFPISPGAYDREIGGYGDGDAFILKLNGSDHQIAYSTFVGNAYGTSRGRGITVDDNGCAYVTGHTRENNFPTTTEAYCRTFCGGYDIFVLKLNPLGSNLVYSTLIGGERQDVGFDIEIDDSGFAFITGETRSFDFPTTPGSFDETHNDAGYEAFVVKIDPKGSSLIFSTVIGGNTEMKNSMGLYTKARALKLDESGNVVLTGITSAANFPTTDQSYDTTPNGGWGDVFVSKLDSTGSSLIFSTFVGGDTGKNEYGNDLILDEEENVIVVGWTRSNTFPTTEGSFDTTFSGDEMTFIFKLNSSGKALDYSTFIGEGYGLSIDLDSKGNPVIAGYTEISSFPTTELANWKTHKGGDDVFISKISGKGNELLYSTFFGGSNDDFLSEMNIGPNDFIYMTGYTKSSDLPITSDAMNSTFNEATEGFYTIIGDNYVHPPGQLSGHIDCNMIRLDWNPPQISPSGIFGYNIYRGNESGNEMLITSIGNENFFIDDTIENGKIYYYYVTVQTTIGESEPSNEIIVYDDQNPILESIKIPEMVYPEDEITISASITDNVCVQEVKLTYWYDDNDKITNSFLKGTNDTWYFSINISDGMDKLSFYLVAQDPSGNEIGSRTFILPIIDDQKPIFTRDLTEEAINVGETIHFSVEVKDNIEVDQVWLEYYFEEGKTTNVSMTRVTGDIWKLELNAYDQIGMVYYRFLGMDGSGNWNSTIIKNISIIDKNLPLVDILLYPDIIFTGQMCEISIHFKEEIHVVNFQYWFGINEEISIIIEDTNPIFIEIKIPYDSSEDLFFSFSANDTSDHWMNSETFHVEVIDGTLPVFGAGWFDNPDFVGTGEIIKISGEIFDNIKLFKTEIKYWFGDDIPDVIDLGKSNGFRELEFDVPTDSTSSFFYELSASDFEMNFNSTTIIEIPIVDTIAPSIGKIDDISMNKGEFLNLSLDLNDNIGIGMIRWESPFEIEGDNISLIIDIIGNHSISVIVYDIQGNKDQISFNLSVLDPNNGEENHNPLPSENDTNHERKRMILMTMILITLVVMILVSIIYRIYGKNRDEDVPLTSDENEM